MDKLVTDEHFNAILAKNAIARDLCKSWKTYPNPEWILFRLKEIETYTGTANQPTVQDIFEHNRNPARSFDI